VRAIEEGAEAAYANRTYKVQPSIFHRHILSRGYSGLVRRFLDIDLSDTETGYKFFRRDKLLPLLDKATDPGWFWDTEIMTYWSLAGYSVAEIPALFIRSGDGSPPGARSAIAWNFRQTRQFRTRSERSEAARPEC
jgi:hypothetical protein